MKNIHRRKNIAITRDGNQMHYYDYLKSHYWYDLKQRYKNSKLKQECWCCDSVLNIVYHHKTYKRLGHERLDDIIPVCRLCHQKIHDRFQRLHDAWKSGNLKNKPKLFPQWRKIKSKEMRKRGKEETRRSLR